MFGNSTLCSGMTLLGLVLLVKGVDDCLLDISPPLSFLTYQTKLRAHLKAPETSAGVLTFLNVY